MAGSFCASSLLAIVHLNLRAFNYSNALILYDEAGWWIQWNRGGISWVSEVADASNVSLLGRL